MISPRLSFDPAEARRVKADSLEPRQRTTPLKLKTACDFYQQHMLKHPFLSDFHSPAEHLYAGLLEGDPTVTSYVPQPFKLRIGRSFYTPDCYVVSDGRPRRVLEIKPKGKISDDLKIPVTHFFAEHGMDFETISNESVYERRIEAENWLEIVRILYMARDIDTTAAEQAVLEKVFEIATCALGDIIDAGDRDRTFLHEIGVLRLLHRGNLNGGLVDRPLDYDIEVSLCE